MSTPSIKVGQGNWGIKAGNLLGYANTEKKFSPVEFTSTRALSTATRVNASGNIEIVNADIPRIDYFGGQASLLVEPSGTNLALQSEDFLTTWSQTALVITTGFSTPFNNANGTLIEALSNTGRLRQTIAAITSGTTHTFSLFAKAGNLALASGVSLTIQEGTSTNFASGVVQSFRLDTGELGASGTLGAGFTLTRASIENYGNGWYRCNMTVTASFTPSSAHIMVRPTSTIVSNLPATVIGGSAYIWGAQLEAGSVATSYIPTTTGTVTRNADVISVTGVAGLIGQTEGTIYAEVDVRNFSNSSRIIGISDGTSNNRIIFIFTTSSRFRILVSVGGNPQVDLIGSSQVAGIFKLAAAYKENDYAFYINGSQVGTDTSALVPACSQVILGKTESSSNTFHFNDRIRAASIYQTRLPNTTTDGSPSLQSITTL
jgi:hypothetical protein